eukprot:664145-Amphidinium_carterae.1
MGVLRIMCATVQVAMPRSSSNVVLPVHSTGLVNLPKYQLHSLAQKCDALLTTAHVAPLGALHAP